MTDKNKEELLHFTKVVIAMIAIMCLVITSCGVWNGVYLGEIDSFYGWVAVVNLLISVYTGHYFFNSWCKKD